MGTSSNFVPLLALWKQWVKRCHLHSYCRKHWKASGNRPSALASVWMIISTFGLVHVMGVGQRQSKCVKVSSITTKRMQVCMVWMLNSFLKWWFSIVVLAFPQLCQVFHRHSYVRLQECKISKGSVQSCPTCPLSGRGDGVDYSVSLSFIEARGRCSSTIGQSAFEDQVRNVPGYNMMEHIATIVDQYSFGSAF